MAGLKKGFIDLPVDKLVSADWNYKKDDEAKQEKLVNNIKRNGQVENIIVRQLETGFYEVINGNHRLKAFKGIGCESVHVYNTGKISDAKARRLAIETNETRFETDTIKLAELIKEISEEFPALAEEGTMPFSAEEMQNMTEMLGFDWDQFSSEQEGAEDGSDGNEMKKIIISVTPDKYDAVKASIESATSEYSAFVKVK